MSATTKNTVNQLPQTQAELDRIFKGFLVSTTIIGNKTTNKKVDQYQMSYFTRLFDRETHKEFSALKQKIRRLPYKFSPPFDSNEAFIINKKPWVPPEKIDDLKIELQKAKDELVNDFVDRAWERIENADKDQEFMRKLHEERNKLTISHKTDGAITGIRQPKLPKDKAEFRSWFDASWDIDPVSQGDSPLSSLLKASEQKLKFIEKQIAEKEKELITKKQLTQAERKKIELELDKIKQKRKNLDSEISNIQNGQVPKEKEHIQLLDMKISNQLQELYLTIDKALMDFSLNGRIVPKRIEKISNHINAINQFNDIANIDDIKNIMPRLEKVPETLKKAQLKLNEGSGELNDLELLDINFDAITTHLKSSNPQTSIELGELKVLGMKFDELKTNPPEKRKKGSNVRGKKPDLRKNKVQKNVVKKETLDELDLSGINLEKINI